MITNLHSEVVPRKWGLSSLTPLMPAAILPVEKLLPSILALCHCHSFLSNTLQNMFRRNSKANYRHISTLTCINVLLTEVIYQYIKTQPTKINLTFINSSFTSIWHYLYFNPWDKNVIILVFPEVKLWQQIIWCPRQSYFKEIVYHSPWHWLRLPVTAKQGTGFISS